MSSSRAESSKRISNACLPCQKRKIRCDGSHPTCASCQRREVACEYAVRKTRGPGRSKEYIQQLEEKVQRLQSSLPPGGASQEPGMGIPNAAPQYLGPSNQASSNAQTNMASHMTEPQNPDVDSLQMDMQKPTTPNVALLMKGLSFMSKVDKLFATVKDVMQNLNTGGFTKTIFTQLMPEMDDIDLLTHILEEINDTYPLMTKASLEELLKQQYAAGLENSVESPGRWAVLNSYFAMLLQWKVANAHRQQFDFLEWGFFKNAYSVFSVLISRGKDVLSCQGLLFMVMVMQGNADTWTATQILSSAARLAQALGLHRQPSDKTAARVNEGKSGTFWMLYILDANEVMKSGLPSCFNQDDLSVEMPPELQRDGVGCYSVEGINKPVNLFRRRAELAVIQARIHRQLFSESATRKAPTELLATVETLQRDLDIWKMGLPPSVQPFFEKDLLTEPEMPVILLHFTYYSCIAKLAVAGKRFGNEATSQSIHPAARVAAARATIRLARHMSSQTFACLWRTLCFPIAASITLLDGILNSPLKSAAQADKKLIGDFISLLQRFQNVERCDLGRILRACRRLYAVASSAINQEMLNPGRVDSGVPVVSKEQVEYIRCQLAIHDDHLLLASGLIGNIPSLTEQAAIVFSPILDVPESSASGYGLLVPDRLKPETFNFTFN